MKTRTLISTVLCVLLVALSSTGASARGSADEPAPDPNATTDPPGKTVCAKADFGAPVLVGKASGQNRSMPIAIDLPDGDYELVLESFDESHGRPDEVDQAAEQWFVEGLDAAGKVVFTSKPIDDLPFGQQSLAMSVGRVSVAGVVSIRARHAHVSDAWNSVVPVAASFEAPSCFGEATDCGVNIVYDDDEAPLLTTVDDMYTVDLGLELPPGFYEVLVSVFDQESHEGQEHEQINVVIDSQEVGPTPDLPPPDHLGRSEIDGISLGVVEVRRPITSATIMHAGTDSDTPESLRLSELHLVCRDGFEPIGRQQFELPMTKLRGDGLGPATTAAVDVAIPPGDYQIVLASFDDAHPESDPQLGEQWRLEGFDEDGEMILSTSPTGDLRDDDRTGVWEVGVYELDRPLHSIRAVHASQDGVNSVYPLSAQFEPISLRGLPPFTNLIVRADQVTSTTMGLRWTPTAVVDSYTVSYDAGPDITVAGDETGVIVEGLDAGQFYAFTVKAIIDGQIAHRASVGATTAANSTSTDSIRVDPLTPPPGPSPPICMNEPVTDFFPTPIRTKVLEFTPVFAHPETPETCADRKGFSMVEGANVMALWETDNYVYLSSYGYVRSSDVEVYTDLPTVAIDPGHGAVERSDGNFYWESNVTLTGLSEDEMVLDIAQKLVDHANQQDPPIANFFLTRETYKAPFAPVDCPVNCQEDLAGRRELAAEREADYLISIHTQGKEIARLGPIVIGPRWPDGTEAYYRYDDDSSRQLGQAIQDEIAALGIEPRGVRQADFAILSREEPHDPDRVSVLIEVAYHTHDRLFCNGCNADKLRSPEFRREAGLAIYDGLGRFLVQNDLL
jgi:N-acetylmuramoyl-L-alanine amidase